MACFIVPTAEAIVITIAAHLLKSKEKRAEAAQISEKPCPDRISRTIPFSRKLQWLSKMLWGGSVMLAFEHVWHGEVEPWFPFLTAAKNPESTFVMLHEMATTGVGMAILVTVVWCGILVASHTLEKQAVSPDSAIQR